MNPLDQLRESIASNQRYFDDILEAHEAEVKYQKSLSWSSGAYTSALFITLALIAAHAIGLINLIGACK